MPHEIPAKYLNKIDQDLSAARANLRQHIADFEKFLDEGDAPETIVAGFAAQMLRQAPPWHLAWMFAVAVLVLTEQKREQERKRDADE